MENVTFCIQGAVVFDSVGRNLTQNLIESITLHFPNSPIIFSTWESENVDFASGVKLIVSKDPGSGIRFLGSKEKNNINRQIISTRAGLTEVVTELVVKLRSDLIIDNKRLEKIIQNLPKTLNHRLSIFDNYVVVLDRLTFSPEKKDNFTLHVTDMLQAGRTSDVMKMWNIKTMTLEQEVFYQNFTPEELALVGNHLPEFRAEQYFWNQLIEKELGFGIQFTLDRTLPSEIRVEELFKFNIIPFRFPTLGISIQKETYKWSKEDSWVSSIYAFTFFDWLRFARKMKIAVNVPIRHLFWEIRGEFYGFLYRKGSNFPPTSKIQRSR